MLIKIDFLWKYSSPLRYDLWFILRFPQGGFPDEIAAAFGERDTPHGFAQWFCECVRTECRALFEAAESIESEE